MKAGFQALYSRNEFGKILEHITSEMTQFVALVVKHRETTITHTTVTKNLRNFSNSISDIKTEHLRVIKATDWSISSLRECES